MLTKIHDIIIRNLKTQKINKNKLDNISIIQLCKKCISILKPITYTDNYNIWYYHFKLSTCYSEIGYYDKALEYAEMMLNLLQYENMLSEIRTYQQLIKAYADVGNSTKSKHYYRKYINFCASLGLEDLPQFN